MRNSSEQEEKNDLAKIETFDKASEVRAGSGTDPDADTDDCEDEEKTVVEDIKVDMKKQVEREVEEAVKGFRGLRMLHFEGLEDPRWGEYSLSKRVSLEVPFPMIALGLFVSCSESRGSEARETT